MLFQPRVGAGRVREELNMALRPERNRFDRALQELQVTLNIARRNSLEDENDTWVLFSDQYLDVLQTVPTGSPNARATVPG
jgi:hypothetical protein